MTSRNTLIALFVAFLAFAFTSKNTEYKVDTQQSKITWVGRKVTGEHSGTISIVNGKLFWDGKNLKGGSFDIDVASIKNTDLTDEENNQKLVGHLKSDDFFSAEKYPTATLVITKVTPIGQNQSQVKGNLTIKGITKEIQFPATVQETGNQIHAKAKIMVDRTKYDIQYGSGSFFENLGDKAIDNEFELHVNLVAEKASGAKAS